MKIEPEFDGKSETDFERWRTLARCYLADGVRPEEILWSTEERNQTGFSLDEVPPPSVAKISPPVTSGVANATPTVPTVDKEFLRLAPSVAAARDGDRWDLLYRILFRLVHENRFLMKVSIDDDIRRFQDLAKSVHRDIHKMHAFVRFKKRTVDELETYVAWHQPEHLTLKLGAPFFQRRFGDRPWSIFTPDLSVHWNLENLSYSAGISQSEFGHHDEMDELWKTYYRSIFNPARIKLKAMTAEMPVKYWASLPEADIIQELLREAPERLSRMAEIQGTNAEVPEVETLQELRQAARGCDACPLAAKATQTVFGEGALGAKIMIVGEQPGDQEDLAGRPFVGPAGEVLDRALLEAGIRREDIYLTNTVKHFKWKPSGKTRLHQKPSGSEMHACRPWLEAEIKKIKPQVIVLLGITAGTAILGRLPKVSEDRGQLLKTPYAPNAILSWHPASILRAPTPGHRDEQWRNLVHDLQLAAAQISETNE